METLSNIAEKWRKNYFFKKINHKVFLNKIAQLNNTTKRLKKTKDKNYLTNQINRAELIKICELMH